ncbi:MAG: hypothetical protein ABS45_09165 [Comamonas sp. SCN 65-56]|uniref:PEP-CTERM sorting domain-containing protein n=1 Tax=Comamonas sp. SCN 65-56 TaxID=1660095 RepID=UPI00086F9875|nr:PEP-CTERM sorting domain-containing protein [Comamonas sp. SCN 65-56]ODS91942.1 MAG: hypothetical protein ABS45_09165 [Comamonas sp. SCN 65-56]
MKYGKFVYGVAAAAVLAFTGTAQASNLVVNGSFEDTTVANGTWGVFSSVNGWNIVADDKNGLELRNNAVGAAYDGNNFAELDANRNMSIWQALTTVIGQAYQLSFAYSPRAGVSTPVGTNNIDVSLNGTAIPGSPFGGSGAGQSGNNWMVYTYNFVADSTSTVLRFAAGGASDSFGGSLDAVSVSAVPLPGAALLFGSALLGAGALRKRKVGEKAQTGTLAA